ncbi:MAG TPA: AAA family ATPase, partial [Methanolinea sp.]|nr:AAA family ATPase [Methanolinea sp.]
MTGRRVIVTGVPGVGKTTVVTGALKVLEGEGITYRSLNFGTYMFETAQKEGFAKDRDEMRRLPGDVQKKLQQSAARAM